MNSIEVIESGPLSTVQDAGRFGSQKYGVSVCGAMDLRALVSGNILVGNEAHVAGIEVTIGSSAFKFHQQTLIALTGSGMDAKLDGTPVPIWESFFAPEGSIIRFSPSENQEGLRLYLCVGGGIVTDSVLGSQSTHIGSGVGGRQLSSRDTIPIGPISKQNVAGNLIPPELRPKLSTKITINVISGPQENVFTKRGLNTFYNSEYKVTEQSNRQGIRLDGPKIETVGDRYDIISDAVTCGSIQVPGDGKPIILMADTQTTGGYAKIGVAATMDLSLLAQARPGTLVYFDLISVDEAQLRLRDHYNALASTNLLKGLNSLTESMIVSSQTFEFTINTRLNQLEEDNFTMAYLKRGGDHLPVFVRHL